MNCKFFQKGFVYLLALIFIDVMFLLVNQLVEEIMLQKNIYTMANEKILKIKLFYKAFNDLVLNEKINLLNCKNNAVVKFKNFTVRGRKIGFVKDNLLLDCKTGVNIYKVKIIDVKTDVSINFWVSLR